MVEFVAKAMQPHIAKALAGETRTEPKEAIRRMADIVPPEVRSRMMAGIRARTRSPEIMAAQGAACGGLPLPPA